MSQSLAYFPASQLAPLTVELATDPAKMGYAGTTDAAAAALLVAQTQQQGQVVAAQAVLDVLYGANQALSVLTQANAARLGTNTLPAATVCQALYDRLQSGQGFDCSNPAVAGQVAADMALMVAAGYLSEAAATAIGALGVKLTSRAAIIGLPQLVAYDAASVTVWVNSARGGV